MKNLFAQIIKFGLVGGICFVIDYLIGLGIMNIFLAVGGDQAFEIGTLVGAIFGFSISAVVNYILSFKFVFNRKEDLNRKVEFIAFITLSIIGLGLNSLLMWISVGPVYSNVAVLHENVGYNLMYTFARAFSAGVVMVYNFITRKVFLESKKSVEA